MSLVSATVGVGVLESGMKMAGRRRKGEVGGNDGLSESKRIERAFKSIGLPSLEFSKTARERKISHGGGNMDEERDTFSWILERPQRQFGQATE